MADSNDLPMAIDPQIFQDSAHDRHWKATFKPATVFSNGVNTFWNEEHHPHENFNDPSAWVDALENVQSSPTATVSADEITQAALFRWDFLPQQFKRLITVHIPTAMYWGAWDHRFVRGKNKYAQDFAERLDSDWEEFLIANNEALIKNFAKSPYHILPIWTGEGHWNLIFIVLQKSRHGTTEYKISTGQELAQDEEDQTSEFQRLVAYAVVDPKTSGDKLHKDDDSPSSYYEKERARHIDGRLYNLFNSCNLISADAQGHHRDCERRLWVPKQEATDNWSSGLRVIDTMWELFRRITDMEMSGLRNVESLFRPMRPFFDPYYTRLDVAGAIAAQALRNQSFRARIVLAQVTAINPKSVPDQEELNPILPRGDWTSRPWPAVEKIPEKFLERTSDDPTGNLANPGWYAQQNKDEGMPELLADIGERFKAGVLEAKKKGEEGKL
ncbi:hypothetical protein F5Y08DRAFT_343843 [Xylaria arbuscula]|nr:hypothetical protein F5Y08DRAFT_343843 [Xylaria arbuscula]